MKAVIHSDGFRRIKMKIEVSVNAELLTHYALDMLSTEPDPVAVLLSANKREIFALARANIQSSGKDGAILRVQQTVDPQAFERAREHVKLVFPEID